MASNWTIIAATGTSHTDGTAFVWDAQGTAARYVVGKFINPTLTPYQTVKFVMSGLPESFGRCGNMLIGNAKADFSEFVYVFIISNKIEIGYYNAGVGGWGTPANYNVLQTENATAGTWPLGGWSLQCGTAVSPNQYIVAFQGSQQLAVTDTAAHIAADANHLFAGQAFFSDARSPIEAAPGKISVWQVLDSSPVAVVGSGMRVFRASTALVSTTLVGSSIPGGFFDNVDYCSADITWNAATSTAKVSTPGMYTAWVCIAFGSEFTNNLVAPIIFKNGGFYLQGPSIDSPSAGVDPQRGVWFPFPLQLAAGDTVLAGLRSNAVITLTGDSTGTITWFSLHKNSP